MNSIFENKDCHSNKRIIYNIIGKADLSNINLDSNLLTIQIFVDNTDTRNDILTGNSTNIQGMIVVDNNDPILYDIIKTTKSCVNTSLNTRN